MKKYVLLMKINGLDEERYVFEGLNIEDCNKQLLLKSRYKTINEFQKENRLQIEWKELLV